MTNPVYLHTAYQGREMTPERELIVRENFRPVKTDCEVTYRHWLKLMSKRITPSRFATSYIFSAPGKLLKADEIAEEIYTKMSSEEHVPRNVPELAEIISRGDVYAFGPKVGDFKNADDIRIITDEEVHENAVPRRRIKARFQAAHGPFFRQPEKLDTRHALVHSFASINTTIRIRKKYDADPVIAAGFSPNFRNHHEGEGIKRMLARFGMKPMDLNDETQMQSNLPLSAIMDYFVQEQERFPNRPELIVGIHDARCTAYEAALVLQAVTNPVPCDHNDPDNSDTAMIHTPNFGHGSAKFNHALRIANRDGHENEPIYLIPGFSVAQLLFDLHETIKRVK